LASGPDFVPAKIVLTPSSPFANDSFRVAVEVKNQGTEAGTGGTLQVWADDQAGEKRCGAVGDQSATVGDLEADESRTLTVGGLPGGAAGAKTLRVFVDSACVTAESNEANNQATATYNTIDVCWDCLPGRGGWRSILPP
jgi:subtilase family serine protease